MAALGLALLTVGCDSPTDNDGNVAQLEGAWSYQASQPVPQLSMQGTWMVTQQSGASFSGSLEYEETDAQGIVRNRVALFSGRILTNDAVDFDAFLDDGDRRHVGRIYADSIAGTWVQGVAGGTISGSFSAVKR